MSQGHSIEGFGFLSDESEHHFIVWLPKDDTAPIAISEHFTVAETRNSLPIPSSHDDKLRVLLSRQKWNAIAEVVRGSFNQTLKRRRLKPGQWKIGQNPVERLLGKELVLLAWGIEEASIALIPIAIQNWLGLQPEERWWLFTMTNAATGQALNGKGHGWRRAVRYALTENPTSGYSLRAIEDLDKQHAN